MKTSSMSHWIGFIIMLAVTGIAFYFVMSSQVVSVWISGILLGFAALQVFLQLFLFMDIREGRKGWKWIALSGGAVVITGAIIYLMLLD